MGSVEFDDYVRASGPRLLRLAWLLTGDEAAAEDLLQDAYARLLPRWRRVARYDDPDAYVRRILVNGRTSRWRRTRREHLTADVPDTRAAGDATAGVVDRDQLAAALRTLGPRQRAVVVCRYYLDMSETEIAAALGVSAGTVKSQAARALANLRLTLIEPTEAEVPCP